MKRLRYLFTILLIIFSAYKTEAAPYSYSQSLRVSVFFANKFRFNISYNICLNGNIMTKNNRALFPFIDIKTSLYKNYLGSSLLPNYANLFSFNTALSVGTYFSLIHDKEVQNIIPIFSSGFANSTTSPYQINLGAATSYVFQLGLLKREKYFRNQRIGNIFINCYDVYFNYYNDGGPLLRRFGDDYDRYWSGGGVLGIRRTINGELQSVEFSYDKYTGFFQNSFEVSSLIFIDNVNYKNIQEVSYNCGKYSLRYFNFNQNQGIGINRWNSKFDFQDWLHRDVSQNPYHYKIEKPYYDVELIYYK